MDRPKPDCILAAHTHRLRRGRSSPGPFCLTRCRAVAAPRPLREDIPPRSYKHSTIHEQWNREIHQGLLLSASVTPGSDARGGMMLEVLVLKGDLRMPLNCIETGQVGAERDE